MNEALDRSLATVLLVDDEEYILRSLERLLLDEDFTILTATSGERGLEMLAGAGNVAVIISDQRMPGMTGAEFLEQARKLAPDAVRMVLTGYADISAAMDAINRGGAARYLAKPWDDGQLTQAICDGVDFYLMQRENRRLSDIVRQQNEELSQWNANLKGRVLEQTALIRKQNDELSRRNERINEAFSGIIHSLSLLVEMCSPTLHSHSRNVTRLAVAMAQELKLPEADLTTIRIASQLHDIGVIGMPPAILAKRGQEMAVDELRMFQQHPVRGQTAVDAVEELRSAGLLIRHHHEQYNGNGYPDRLSREEIPLGSRIIGFADHIDREMGKNRTSTALAEVFTRATLQLGMALDPQLMPAAQRHAAEIYCIDDDLAATGFEKECQPQDLLSGMQVARDLYSGTGIMLIAKGVALDLQMIESLKRYYKIDPPASGIHVSLSRQ